ncbi:putative vesicular transport protein (CDC48) [Trypanosoma cruzi]|uniref:Vesicular transport protein (CDC48 homologue), putative n=3 Tax=Trypanosoma cruzi TaxID=5693 RepID=Q4DQD6_TRYCC|nr:vesicular transport protein (CDC48 homologue), putative [Trypanosoma cruzi]EAN94730.1 vesicular transport protein (CDC48 homologue), putative [Trypanosoma cruzi]PWV19621.1 putative vesicular transport protein (CDC48) [Trypanosoma cruzi]|eukprot:XP_816581.1 vesicular transport protein (CDC48 homologue) [Trypanosoma cruzi strain CL Brener]
MSSQMRRLMMKQRQNGRYYHGQQQQQQQRQRDYADEVHPSTRRNQRDDVDKRSTTGKNKRSRGEEGIQATAANGEEVIERLGIIPKVTLDEMGGLAKEIPIIKELIELPIRSPHLFSRLGADPPCGVLLHGPPGCGKTKLVHAIAGSLETPLFFVAAPEIVSGISGDSEAKLRNLFMDAISAAPSIVFIDEIDTIAGRRDQTQRGMESRIVGQLLSCMDQVAQAWRQENKVVCVMGATNRPEAIDTALRRAGRFDREIALGIPTMAERESILNIICQKLNVASDVDFFELANMTPGYVGADLHLLVKEACILAIRRKYNELEATGELENPNAEALISFTVTFDEMKEATKRVQPSAMREGFTTIPNVTWNDVGALEDVREELFTSILQPIRAPRLHRRFGLDHPVGVLLYGPPGCGKTLVAKAIANQSGANFISIKGPELLNKFVGESERSVRMVFARGRASAPCVLFFDELDALAPRRGSDRANPSSERVVNQLLTEMDGIEGREDVYVIGATNRPDMIDPAMLRPGRLDKLLYVPLPSVEQRVSILATHARRYPIDASVDLNRIAHDPRLQGFSGADLAALVREASLHALKKLYRSTTAEELDLLERNLGGESIEKTLLPSVCDEDFEASLQKVRPSVSAEDRESYELLHRHIIQSARSTV